MVNSAMWEWSGKANGCFDELNYPIAYERRDGVVENRRAQKAEVDCEDVDIGGQDIKFWDIFVPGYYLLI